MTHAEEFDLSQCHPRLRPELIIRLSQRDGTTRHLLEDPLQGKTYQLGVREASFLLAMDGSLTLDQYQRDHSHEISLQQLSEMFYWAQRNGLWQDYSESSIARDRLVFQHRNHQNLTRWMNPVIVKWSLGCPDHWVRRFVPVTGWLFTKPAAWVWAVLGLITLVMFQGHFHRFSVQTAESLRSGGWILMVIVWLVAKVIHEAAHAVACHKVGARVSQAGVILILGMPLAYVDVSQCNRLANRWDRIKVSVAGVYVESLITFLALWIWLATDNRDLQNTMQAWVVTSGLTTLLFNANPLMRFDGYYVLADLLDISNLASRGKSVFLGSLASWMLGIPTPANTMAPWRRAVLWIYGMASFLWRILLGVTLILAASAMFHGAGILLAIVAGYAWFLHPTLRWAKRWSRAEVRKTLSVARCLFSASVIAGLLVISLRLLTGPVWLAAPAVVQRTADGQVRAAASGFVQRVLVHSDQRVVVGQPLLRLDNPELESELAELRLELQQAELRRRWNQQQDQWSDAAADETQYHSLKNRLEKKQHQFEQLVVRAPSAGRVVPSQVESLLGNWVDCGAVLLTLDNDQKELKVSVSQDDLLSLKQHFDHAVAIRLVGQPDRTGRFTGLVPNATAVIWNPRLTDRNGGPLPVRPVSNQDDAQSADPRWEMTQPRFVATVRPDGSWDDVPAGQTGYVYFRSQKHSLGSYLWLRVRKWFRDHLPRIV